MPANIELPVLEQLAERIGKIAVSAAAGNPVEAALLEVQSELKAHSKLGFATTADLERMKRNYDFQLEQLGYRIDHALRG